MQAVLTVAAACLYQCCRRATGPVALLGLLWWCEVSCCNCTQLRFVLLPCPQHMFQCSVARHCHHVGGSGDTEVLFGCSWAVTGDGCCVTPVPYDSTPGLHNAPAVTEAIDLCATKHWRKLWPQITLELQLQNDHCVLLCR